MRPLISWADLAGRRVGVWGPAGVEGQASLRKLAALGITPAVLVDDAPASAGPGSGAGPGPGPAVLATADGGLEALASCDVVVKAPGISRYREDARWLADRGVTIAGGLGLWLAGHPDGHVIAITGTKGKSSTTAIAGHLLTRLGYPAMTGGNIGRLPYDPDLDAAGPPPRYWVIEVSSYQATDLPVSPPVTAVTSLHPDHLPWHGGVEQYYRDKLSACSQPGAEVTVANGDSDLLRERAALLGPRVEWVSADDDPGADWMAPLGLLGAHSRRNALIARACLRRACPGPPTMTRCARPPRALPRWPAGSRSSARRAA
jgi:UDP-N-acetylmuramoyl-L-alanine---L-glutamate ligase